MAKTYYSREETLARLGCTEDQLRGLVRDGKLREFRDAGKMNYRVEEVDKLQAGPSADSGAELSLDDSTVSGTPKGSLSSDTGDLQLEDSGDLPLSLEDSQEAPAKPVKPAKPAAKKAKVDSEAPISLTGSDTGSLSLGDTGSGELKLDDSGTAAPPANLKGESSAAGADALSLDDVDTESVGGLKKDDTVITNIGISVFDDDDLEIAADPMAKTVLAGGDEHMGLDGSGAGSGLLDLTRESDDTSLGAELLEGIDMGDTAESKSPAPAAAVVAEPLADDADLEAPGLAPALPMHLAVAMVEPVSPAFTGLLIAGALSLALAGAMAIATSMNAWPGYLNSLAGSFWMFLGGTVLAGGLFAGVGFLIGRAATAGPKPPKAAKPKKEKPAKKDKKGKKTAADAE